MNAVLLMKCYLILIPSLLFVGRSCAETIDWSRYTEAELIAMHSAIHAELLSCSAPPEASQAGDSVIVSNGKEARVRGYKGITADVVIPSEHEGFR